MSNPATTQPRIITLGVLGGAYKGKRASLAITLTHSVAIDQTYISLCGNENMADEYSSEPEDHALAPTCKRCLRKDPRFNGK